MYSSANTETCQYIWNGDTVYGAVVSILSELVPTEWLWYVQSTAPYILNLARQIHACWVLGTY
jgi:hypothetical protein